MASFAAKLINLGAAGNRQKPRVDFTIDPTTGALKVAPHIRLKAAKALRREVQKIKFTLLRDKLTLKREILFLSVKCSLFRVVRELPSILEKVVLSISHVRPRHRRRRP